MYTHSNNMYMKEWKIAWSVKFESSKALRFLSFQRVGIKELLLENLPLASYFFSSFHFTFWYQQRISRSWRIFSQVHIFWDRHFPPILMWDLGIYADLISVFWSGSYSILKKLKKKPEKKRKKGKRKTFQMT